MKIVNRTTFLAMPAGTLFSSYRPCSFGELLIKGDTFEDCNDFYEQVISGAVKCDDSEEYTRLLNQAQKTGESVALDFYCEDRNGEYGSHKLYAVWEPTDVLALIIRLQETLL